MSNRKATAWSTETDPNSITTRVINTTPPEVFTNLPGALWTELICGKGLDNLCLGYTDDRNKFLMTATEATVQNCMQEYMELLEELKRRCGREFVRLLSERRLRHNDRQQTVLH